MSNKYEVRPYMVDSKSILVAERGNCREYRSEPCTPYQSGFGVYDVADNRCVFTTGRGTDDAESRAACEAHIIEREAGERLVAVQLTDGRLIEVVANIAAEVRGVDRDGLVLVAGGVREGEEWLYALTPCCQASGKGSGDSETGVVCRSCYCDVDGYFGDVFGTGAISAFVAQR